MIDTPNWLDKNPPPRVLIVAGVRWTVYESSHAYDRRERPHLIFESDTLVRRVHDYPHTWRSLNDDALWELSWTGE
ncbi:MAG TPA: hypothetical protein VIB98_02030 [Gemmatimonadaceae bacterium]